MRERGQGVGAAEPGGKVGERVGARVHLLDVALRREEGGGPAQRRREVVDVRRQRPCRVDQLAVAVGRSLDLAVELVGEREPLDPFDEGGGEAQPAGRASSAP